MRSGIAASVLSGTTIILIWLSMPCRYLRHVRCNVFPIPVMDGPEQIHLFDIHFAILDNYPHDLKVLYISMKREREFRSRIPTDFFDKFENHAYIEYQKHGMNGADK